MCSRVCGIGPRQDTTRDRAVHLRGPVIMFFTHVSVARRSTWA
jgi:hypothetical protein